jgi:hypothetical protein
MFDWIADISLFTWNALKSFGVPIVSILITAALARRWQQRNWLVQQRISDQEKRHAETRLLFDEFVAAASERHFRSKRLLWALLSLDTEKTANARSAYDETVVKWNDVDLSRRVRFIKNFVNGTALYSEIDDRITVPFVEIGRKLEKGIRKVREKNLPKNPVLSTSEVEGIERNLNSVSRAVFEIGREIYGQLEYLSDDRLNEDKITKKLLAEGKYDELSYFQLLGVVFTSRPHSRFY